MDGQLSFATLDYAGKKKRTKRDVFLAEMAVAVPWSVLEAVIAPHYPKEGPQGGRRAFPIAVMLRIYCLQQWYVVAGAGDRLGNFVRQRGGYAPNVKLANSGDPKDHQR
jgi:hypothetical protein